MDIVEDRIHLLPHLRTLEYKVEERRIQYLDRVELHIHFRCLYSLQDKILGKSLHQAHSLSLRMCSEVYIRYHLYHRDILIELHCGN